MVRLTIQEHILVVKTFYCHNESFAEIMHHLRRIMGRDEVPNESSVRRLIVKLNETSSVQDVKIPTR